jgi:hypothetical protein
MKFLLMMQVDHDVLEALTPQQNEALGQGHAAFAQGIRRSRELISAVALGEPSGTSVIRGSVGGIPLVSDGPFLASGQFFGGFYLVDVDSRERAIELACLLPDVTVEGLAIEVREVLFSSV